MLFLLLQVPLALLDELVHGRGSLGRRDGRSRGQWGLWQGWQGSGWLQLWGLLLADNWQEKRKGGPVRRWPGSRCPLSLLGSSRP